MTRLSQFSAISDSRLFLLLHSGVGSTVIDAGTLISPDQRLGYSGEKKGKKNKIKQKSNRVGAPESESQSSHTAERLVASRQRRRERFHMCVTCSCWDGCCRRMTLSLSFPASLESDRRNTRSSLASTLIFNIYSCIVCVLSPTELSAVLKARSPGLFHHYQRTRLVPLTVPVQTEQGSLP